MKSRNIFVILLLIALVGCASVDITKTAKGFYEPTDPNEIDILKTLPEKQYVELGTVTATGFKPEESAVMHNAIRSKSAALGANAVILTEEGIINGNWHIERWATGVAIRYK